jgi:Family of unknown function (DUF6502)
MPETNHPALRALLPIAQLCLASGLKLPDLVEGMKAALVEAATPNRGDSAARLSDSQISVLTGVHRKDLRRFKTDGALKNTYKASLASQVFSRWRSDPLFLTKAGSPRVLPRIHPDADGRSFEALVISTSQDVHPRSVLDELLRLNMVEINARDNIKLLAKAFIPKNDANELWQISSQNAYDHLMAIAHNLTGRQPQFLEQALFSDELSTQSAKEFNRLSATCWRLAFEFMLPRLRDLIAQDRAQARPATQRVSLGLYSFVAESQGLERPLPATLQPRKSRP